MNNTPKLRFKEFTDEWQEKKLGEIADVKRGASPRPINSSLWFSDKSKIGWVRISDVTNSNKILNKTTQYLSDEGVKRSHFVKAGNLIMSICATIGRPICTGVDVCIHDGFVVFDRLKTDREFLYYLLIRMEKGWYHYGQPGSQVNLNSSIVANEKVSIPIQDEQEKIAGFLTAVDEKISHLEIKKTQFEKYKKGVMQAIFSQKVRFLKPDGSNYPDWEEKKLGEICEYKNGGSFESAVVENGRYYLITLNSIDIDGRIRSYHKTVDRADWFLQKDDLIMVLSDVAHGNFLGLVDIIPKDNKYVLNQRMGLLRKKNKDFDLKFLRTYINKRQKYFKLHGQGSSQQNLSKGDILKFKIPSPCLLEQKKIAEFLTSLDNKVELTNKELGQVKLFKKSLLQQMFM